MSCREGNAVATCSFCTVRSNLPLELYLEPELPSYTARVILFLFLSLSVEKNSNRFLLFCCRALPFILRGAGGRMSRQRLGILPIARALKGRASSAADPAGSRAVNTLRQCKHRSLRLPLWCTCPKNTQCGQDKVGERVLHCCGLELTSGAAGLSWHQLLVFLARKESRVHPGPWQTSHHPPNVAHSDMCAVAGLLCAPVLVPREREICCM